MGQLLSRITHLPLARLFLFISQVVLIYIKFVTDFYFFFFKLLKVEMYFLTSQTYPYSGFSKAIYTAGESFVLSLGLQE